MARLWVAVLHITDRTAQKIRHKHHIEPEVVRQAILCVEGLDARRDVHPERGERWFVHARIGARWWQVVLYPSPRDPDEFALGSCYPD